MACDHSFGLTLQLQTLAHNIEEEAEEESPTSEKCEAEELSPTSAGVPPPPLPLSDEATCTTLDSIAALQGVIPPQVFGDGDRDVVLQLTLAPGESVNLTIICVDVPVSMCACMCVRMNFC